MPFRTSIFAIPYSVFQGFSIFQSIASNTLFELQHSPKQPPNVSKILPRSSQEPPKTPSWRRLGRQLRSLGALLAALGRSWPLLGRSWDALGTLLGRYLTLLDALDRSWNPFGTLLARFRDLQGCILASPGRPQRYFKRILSNPSARKRTFRKSTESCPRTVREESENQIHQRCTTNSLLDFLSPRS